MQSIYSNAETCRRAEWTTNPTNSDSICKCRSILSLSGGAFAVPVDKTNLIQRQRRNCRDLITRCRRSRRSRWNLPSDQLACQTVPNERPLLFDQLQLWRFGVRVDTDQVAILQRK